MAKKNIFEGIQPDAVPRCPYFGICGGCAAQDISYERQLVAKLSFVKKQLGELVENLDLQITGAPDPYEYRTRMDYVTVEDPIKEPNIRMGLRKKGHFNHVVDLHECHLIKLETFQKIRQIFESISEQKYDLYRRTGWLRYLVVRTHGDSHMLSVVTAGREHAESMEQIAKQALELGFTSVYWLLNDTVTDDSKGEVVQYWGEQYLKVKVGDKLSLNIGPNNFCQNNIEVFEEILSYVDEYLTRNDLFTGKLYDLYAGVGAIGLYFAQKFEQVYACELDAQSVELAKLNAVENGISNYEIVAADAATLGALATPDVVIVDPPRAGLLPRGVEEVLSLGAKSLVYISCNPTTQAQDLAALSSQYKIVSARAFDMFPQTPHVENVVVLELIND